MSELSQAKDSQDPWRFVGHCYHGIDRNLYRCQQCDQYDAAVKRDFLLCEALNKFADAVTQLSRVLAEGQAR